MALIGFRTRRFELQHNCSRAVKRSLLSHHYLAESQTFQIDPHVEADGISKSVPSTMVVSLDFIHDNLLPCHSARLFASPTERLHLETSLRELVSPLGSAAVSSS